MDSEMRQKLQACLQQLGFQSFRHNQEAAVIAGLEGAVDKRRSRCMKMVLKGLSCQGLHAVHALVGAHALACTMHIAHSQAANCSFARSLNSCAVFLAFMLPYISLYFVGCRPRLPDAGTNGRRQEPVLHAASAHVWWPQAGDCGQPSHWCVHAMHASNKTACSRRTCHPRSIPCSRASHAWVHVICDHVCCARLHADNERALLLACGHALRCSSDAGPGHQPSGPGCPCRVSV